MYMYIGSSFIGQWAMQLPQRMQVGVSLSRFMSALKRRRPLAPLTLPAVGSATQMPIMGPPMQMRSTLDMSAPASAKMCSSGVPKRHRRFCASGTQSPATVTTRSMEGMPS